LWAFPRTGPGIKGGLSGGEADAGAGLAAGELVAVARGAADVLWLSKCAAAGRGAACPAAGAAGAAARAVAAVAAAFEFLFLRLSVYPFLLIHDEMTSRSATRRHIFSRLRRDCGGVMAIARRIACI